MGNARGRQAAIIIGIIVAIALGAAVTRLAGPPGHPTNAPTGTRIAGPSYDRGVTPPVATEPAPPPATGPAGSIDIDQYAQMVGDGIDRMNGTAPAGMVCDVGDVRCIAGLRSAITAVDALQQQLTSTTPPACVGDLNTMITTALTDYRNGLSVVLSGVIRGSSAQTTSGSNQVIASAQSINAALDELATRDCVSITVSL